MAYTGTLTLRGNAGAAGTSSGATGSFTPSAGETLIAWVLARNASAYPVNSISDSLGSTWTRIGSADFQGPATNAFVSVGLFRLDVGGSPSAMTVTGSSNNGSTTAVLVVSATALGTITNFAGYASSTTPNTGTLTGDAILTYNGRQTTSTVTTPTGYTALIASTGYNAQLAHRAAYDLSSPGTQNWGTGNNNVTVSLELVDATSGTTHTVTAGAISVTGQAIVNSAARVVSVTAQTIAYAAQVVSSVNATIGTVTAQTMTYAGQAISVIRATVSGVVAASVTHTTSAFTGRAYTVVSAAITYVGQAITAATGTVSAVAAATLLYAGKTISAGVQVGGKLWDRFKFYLGFRF